MSFIRGRGVRWLAAALLLAAVAGALWYFQARWQTWLRGGSAGTAANSDTPQSKAKTKRSASRSRSAAAAAALEVLKLSPQAQRNLRLVSQPATLQNYWRTIQIPGEIRDRPGISDRGVTSSAVGVVSAIHRFPGDAVQPGQPLFTLQLFSEYLQNTQAPQNPKTPPKSSKNRINKR